MFDRFTERARKVMTLARQEAQRFNHDYIGTEHILLGLIREGEGVAAQVLVKLGADLNRVRQQVIQLLSGYQGKEQVAVGAKFGDKLFSPRTCLLSSNFAWPLYAPYCCQMVPYGG